MHALEKRLSYTATNGYHTMNDLTDNTKRIWVVFHGMGQLARYFIRYFDGLPSGENYIIAPQAPSKYYLDNNHSRVGASWLTKQNTGQEMENILLYLDALYQKESIPANIETVVLGFSQGVSIASRWVAQRKISCSHLILYAGGIPIELQRQDLAFLEDLGTSIFIIVGDNDVFLTPQRRIMEDEKIERLFGKRARHISFKGGHEIKKELIEALIP
tara:strand:- start:103612 stop:104259 length:648 start_codon:yes stop_codon:yes gene_type:complete